jgi:hypothetical protein
MMFVATAVAAGLVAGDKGMTDPAAHLEVINFGKLVVLAITKTYAVRMAGVFMTSLATIWLKTGLIFPAWVLVVSGLILARAGLFEELRDSHR